MIRLQPAQVPKAQDIIELLTKRQPYGATSQQIASLLDATNEEIMELLMSLLSTQVYVTPGERVGQAVYRLG